MNWKRLSDIHFRLLEEACDQCSRAFAMLNNITPHLTGMPGAHDHESMLDKNMDRYLRAQQYRDTLLAERDALIDEATPLVESIPKERTRDIMTRYYLYGKTVCEITKALNCSRRSVEQHLRAGEKTGDDFEQQNL